MTNNFLIFSSVEFKSVSTVPTLKLLYPRLSVHSNYIYVIQEDRHHPGNVVLGTKGHLLSVSLEPGGSGIEIAGGGGE